MRSNILEQLGADQTRVWWELEGRSNQSVVGADKIRSLKEEVGDYEKAKQRLDSKLGLGFKEYICLREGCVRSNEAAKAGVHQSESKRQGEGLCEGQQRGRDRSSPKQE